MSEVFVTSNTATSACASTASRRRAKKKKKNSKRKTGRVYFYPPPAFGGCTPSLNFSSLADSASTRPTFPLLLPLFQCGPTARLAPTMQAGSCCVHLLGTDQHAQAASSRSINGLTGPAVGTRSIPLYEYIPGRLQRSPIRSGQK